MSFDLDPYQYMLLLRENKILYSYLERAGVTYNEERGWAIYGESSLGSTDIFYLNSGVIRMILPIQIPSIPPEVLTKLLMSMQNDIEGILNLAIDSNTNSPYLEYFIHIMPGDAEGLDRSLLLFLTEKKQIEVGFATIIDQFKNMKGFAEGVSQMMNNRHEGEIKNSNDSIWNVVDAIDKKEDEDEDEDDEDTLSKI